MNFEEFNEVAESLFGFITQAQREKFRALEGLYQEWNSKINVISRKDMDEFYLHHVLHSLGIAIYLKDNGLIQEWIDGGFSVLDVGTGGGFPGIPLAILFPKVQFTLCDSIGKKISVAASVAASVGLENVQTVVARAESLKCRYRYVVSRAVTSLDNFLPWVKGKYEKSIFYLKGGDLTEEIAGACRKCHLKADAVQIQRLDSSLEAPWFKEKMVIKISDK